MMEPDIARQAIVAGQALSIGTRLSGDQFTITDQIGAGGFGITYRATDNVLKRTVVVKECFYEDFCVRENNAVEPRSAAFAEPVQKIVKMFMREAQSLAKLRHPNIVGVHRAFEENNTAYMVLDLIEGRDLFDLLAGNTNPLSPKRVKDILLQLLNAIEEVHNIGLLHRDISPDNILIEETGTPVLIDFGAARADASHHTRAVTSMLVVKDGYSPQEFYVPGSEQRPCSDLYALAATFYHILSGKAPPNSQSRMVEIAGHRPDPCAPLAGRIEGYDTAFLESLDKAMAIHPDDRLQSASQWRGLIADACVDEGAPAKRVTTTELSLELERSLSRLVEETNDEVRRTSEIPPQPKEVVVPDQKNASQKPDWVEEFNQMLSPSEESGFEEEEVVEVPEPAASFEPRTVRSDTNWISLAHEKQERMILERERELELLEAGELVTSRSPTIPSSPESDVIELSERTGQSGPTKIIVGLLVGFCSAAAFVVF
jgi:serine/threonine protein kinase